MLHPRLFVGCLSAKIQDLLHPLFKNICFDKGNTLGFVSENDQSIAFLKAKCVSCSFRYHDLAFASDCDCAPKMFANGSWSYFYIADPVVLMNKGIDCNTVEFCEPIAFVNVGICFTLFPFGIGLSRNANGLGNLFLRQPSDAAKKY